MGGVRLGGIAVVIPGTLPFSLLEGTTPPEDADQTNVWIVTAGVPIRLTPYTDPTCSSPPCAGEMHSPKLSPDGTLVAYCDFNPDSPFGMALWVVPVDGSATYPLTPLNEDANGSWMNHPCWHPNGDKIVISDANPDGGSYIGGTLGGRIVEVTYPGNVSTDLWTPQVQSPTQRESGNAPQYSPDGTKILFFVQIEPGGGGTLSRQGLWVMDDDGSNVLQLDNWSSASTNHGYLDSGTQAAWSHDSAWIAYVDRGFAGGGTWSVYKIRPDGTDKTLLADGSAGTVRHSVAHSAWLPDDSAVICTERSSVGRRAILSAAADGSGTTELVPNADGPEGGQNFQCCYRDFRSNRLNWIYQTNISGAVIIRTSAIDGSDMQDTYSPVEATVASGTGFEWV
jgi:Tol biopolymer transport system component